VSSQKSLARTRRCLQARGVLFASRYTYSRQLDAAEHTPGKRHTQKIERRHLTLRTRIKRLTRKTICFSNTFAKNGEVKRAGQAVVE
jgi:IS1 family transposase